jgi:UDP-3-O-[3-hydroxymyristoyl] glucosamine N-acyltransferase
VFPFCNLGIGASIGRHCIIGTFGLIGHFSQVGDNCVIRPGVMIVGRSQMGSNCILNFKSSIINAVRVCDNIELMAFSAITKHIDRPGRYLGTPARLGK